MNWKNMDMHPAEESMETGPKKTAGKKKYCLRIRSYQYSSFPILTDSVVVVFDLLLGIFNGIG